MVFTATSHWGAILVPSMIRNWKNTGINSGSIQKLNRITESVSHRRKWSSFEENWFVKSPAFDWLPLLINVLFCSNKSETSGDSAPHVWPLYWADVFVPQCFRTPSPPSKRTYWMRGNCSNPGTPKRWRLFKSMSPFSSVLKVCEKAAVSSFESQTTRRRRSSLKSFCSYFHTCF